MRVVDLFCGGGGFSQGFKEAGFDIIFGLDKDKKACETFQYNFPDATVVWSPIEIWDKYPSAEVVIGSPPCVEFSKGNVNRTWDTSLIDLFLKVVELIQPAYYIMENVPDAINAINNLDMAYKGKFPTQVVLSADDFGCATRRKRLFAGRFPRTVTKSNRKRAVKDVINIHRPGYRQPFKDSVYRKIDPDKPLFTICQQRIGNERYLLPNGTSLTVSELATIQGFPSYYVFPCSRSEAQRQIGNAVCPPVARAIAERICEVEK